MLNLFELSIYLGKEEYSEEVVNGLHRELISHYFDCKQFHILQHEDTSDKSVVINNSSIIIKTDERIYHLSYLFSDESIKPIDNKLKFIKQLFNMEEQC